jgi:predicted transcriptional regulator
LCSVNAGAELLGYCGTALPSIYNTQNVAEDRQMTDDQDRPRLLGFAAQIVSAHVSKNAVAAQELPPLIERVYEALRNAGAEPAAEPARPEPAAPIKKSVFPDYLICLEDGKKLKMLKRHLRTAYNMSPDEYRKRWGLPTEYPMVAPNYAKHRSTLAREIGLGTRRRSAEPSEPAEPAAKLRSVRAPARKGPVARRRARATAE